MIRKGGPGSRGAKFEVSKNGKVQYFHHGNTQHSSGHGLAHPFVSPFKPVIKPVVNKAVVKPKSKDEEKSKLTRVAKASPTRKPSKATNHHVAAGHKNFIIKRG